MFRIEGFRGRDSILGLRGFGDFRGLSLRGSGT